MILLTLSKAVEKRNNIGILWSKVSKNHHWEVVVDSSSSRSGGSSWDFSIGKWIKRQQKCSKATRNGFMMLNAWTLNDFFRHCLLLSTNTSSLQPSKALGKHVKAAAKMRWTGENHQPVIRLWASTLFLQLTHTWLLGCWGLRESKWNNKSSGKMIFFQFSRLFQPKVHVVIYLYARNYFSTFPLLYSRGGWSPYAHQTWRD